MKKYLYAAAVLAVANAGLYLASSCSSQETKKATRQEPECYWGGKGFRECSNVLGTVIDGITLTTQLSVTCREGSWACCGLEAHCLPDSLWND